MKLIDIHSHWGTKRGYPLRTEEELTLQRQTWNSEVRYHSEAEMAQYFRDNNVRVILDLGFAKYQSPEEMQALHDYAFEVEKQHKDVILGHWIHVDPIRTSNGVSELRRCIDKRNGFLGFAVSSSLTPPASDPSFDPYYRLCVEAGIPVLIFVGTTGLGAGLPAGGGVILDNCHPRYLDNVAARYSGLHIVAARPGWPWQAETNAVLLHKRNIWYELHGWSPKYHAPELKYEIPRRLRNRVMFAADYPLFTYERLVRDWRAEGYAEEVLEQVFYRNGEAFLASLKQ